MKHKLSVVKIGPYEVEGWESDDDLAYRYVIDASGEPNSSWSQKFYATYLKRVSERDLPDALSLTIQNPNQDFKKLNFIEIRKKGNNTNFTFILCFDYVLWDMKESLPSFVDRFIDVLRKNLGTEVKPVKTEYGYFVEVTFSLTGVDDVFTFYTKYEHEIDRLYRGSLIREGKLEKSASSYGEDRFHWWIRYVIVPLACSGTVAAVLAKYLLNA